MTDPNESELLNLTLDEFLSAVAKRASTPGGGAVAGAAGALAACLARMVTAYSIPKDEAGSADYPAVKIAAALAQFDARLRALIDEDARAYEAYVIASRDKSGSAEALEQREAATRLSMAVPMQIAVASNEVLGALQELVAVANKWLLSDLEAAAILAEAAVRSAHCFVWVNAQQLSDSSEMERACGEFHALEDSAKARLSGVERAMMRRLKRPD